MAGMLTRRQVLATLATTFTAGLTGCNTITGRQDPNDTGSTTTPFSSSCKADLANVFSRFDDRLLPFRKNEYHEDSLVFTTIALPIAFQYHQFHLFDPYFDPVKLHAQRISLPLGKVTRLTTLRPPDDISNYCYFDYSTTYHRELFVNKLKTQARGGRGYELHELAGYDEYTVMATSTPAVGLIAFDDERILVVPSARGPVNLSDQDRLDRLLALQRGEFVPHHCGDMATRQLLAQLPMSHLLRVRYRPYDGFYPAENLHAPEGAHAVAFSVNVGGSVPAIGTDHGTTDERTTEPVERPKENTPVLSNETATAPSTTPPVEDVPVKLFFAAVFPNRITEEAQERVRRHVRERQSFDQGLSFDNPTYEQEGLVSIVTETRQMTSMIGTGS